jgi:hypothetical protein
MNGELVRIWKSAVVTYISVLSLHSLRYSEENHAKSQSGLLVILPLFKIWIPPEYKPQVVPLNQICLPISVRT